MPVSSDQLLPVFVYIYGGQHLYGIGTYDKIDPQKIVETGVVVVVPNFRSGPFGNLEGLKAFNKLA